MLQRVQTIYLLLASVSGALTFFLPYAQFYENDVMLLEYAAFGVFNVQSDVLEMTSPLSLPLWIFAILSTVLPLVIVGFYKNRKRQLQLNRLAYVVYLCYFILIYFGIQNISEAFYNGTAAILYHAGFYGPVAAIAFSFLAARGIKKDEELVRSIDRIR